MLRIRLLSFILLLAFVVPPRPALSERKPLPPPLEEAAASDALGFTIKPARRSYSDVGDFVWQYYPAALLDAIREAEGVPSYGNIRLARRYGGHARVPAHIARSKTQELVRNHYNEWASRGKNGRFLVYLRNRYAPIGAANDPTRLNRHWISNVVKALPPEVMVEAKSRGLK